MKILSLKLILCLFVVTGILSCSKNHDSKYYVKLKINGTWVTWEKAIGELGPDLANAAKTDFGVTANNDNSSDIFDLSVQVDGPNFNTGIYDSDNSNYLTLISYSKDVTSTFEDYEIESKSGQPDARYLVNVTSITPTELTGTFTGNYLYDYFDDKTLNVTEGEFFVRRAR
ncbi:MAG: hypothetical protein ABI480_10315 [Chitinophagaceae bacterium]